MFGLVSSAIKLTWLIGSYSTILIYLAKMTGYSLSILSTIFDNGVPELVGYVLATTISTLNWIFTPKGVELAMMVWLTLPAVKFTLYLTKKFVWVA